MLPVCHGCEVDGAVPAVEVFREGSNLPGCSGCVVMRNRLWPFRACGSMGKDFPTRECTGPVCRLGIRCLARDGAGNNGCDEEQISPIDFAISETPGVECRVAPCPVTECCDELWHCRHRPVRHCAFLQSQNLSQQVVLCINSPAVYLRFQTGSGPLGCIFAIAHSCLPAKSRSF